MSTDHQRFNSAQALKAPDQQVRSSTLSRITDLITGRYNSATKHKAHTMEAVEASDPTLSHMEVKVTLDPDLAWIFEETRLRLRMTKSGYVRTALIEKLCKDENLALGF